MKKLTVLMALTAVMLTGCAHSGFVSEPAPTSEPWNLFNIMETENGYYNNNDYYELWDESVPDTSSENPAIATSVRTEKGYDYNINSYHLWYMDKESGKCVMVCDKPECPHDGRDSCTATFRNLLSGPMRLYDNAVYFIAPETKKDKVTVSLYRTAPDGTSIDICTELMNAPNSTIGLDYWLDCSDLVIHKGYAYSNFILLTESGGYNGFHGGGFYRTDLRTGKTTAIETYNDYWDSKIVDYIACGDYIIFAKTDNHSNIRYFSLNIETEEQRELPLDKNEKAEMLTADENKVYFRIRAGKRNSEIISLTPDNPDVQNDEKITVPRDGQLFAYKGKLYAYYIMDTLKSVAVYENGKELLNTTDLPMNRKSDTHVIMLSFTHDKIYAIVETMANEQLWSCPVDEFVSGNINWTCVIDSKTISPPCEDYVKSFK